MAIFGLNAGDAPPIAQVSKWSSGYTPASVASYLAAGAATLSGALTANTYKEMYSYTGAGRLELVGVTVNDGTSRTIGLKVVIDGVTFYDVVSAATTTPNAGIMLIGDAALVYHSPQPFNQSVSISIKSSLSETDKLTFYHALVKVA